MELNYTQKVDPQTGETVGPEQPRLLYRWPFITSGQIAIIVLSVTVIAMLGVMINLIVEKSKLRVRTVVSEKHHHG